jgi:hypothetical protein
MAGESHFPGQARRPLLELDAELEIAEEPAKFGMGQNKSRWQKRQVPDPEYGTTDRNPPPKAEDFQLETWRLFYCGLF